MHQVLYECYSRSFLVFDSTRITFMRGSSLDRFSRTGGRKNECMTTLLKDLFIQRNEVLMKKKIFESLHDIFINLYVKMLCVLR